MAGGTRLRCVPCVLHQKCCFAAAYLGKTIGAPAVPAELTALLPASCACLPCRPHLPTAAGPAARLPLLPLGLAGDPGRSHLPRNACSGRWAGRRAGLAVQQGSSALLRILSLVGSFTRRQCACAYPIHTPSIPPALPAVAGGRLWPVRARPPVPRRQQDPAAGACVCGPGGLGFLQAGVAACPCMPLRLLAPRPLGLPPADAAGGMQSCPVPSPAAARVTGPMHTKQPS